MAMPGFPRPMTLQRQLYRRGQLLRSADLGDGLADGAQLRWWHNRALHNTFGVAAGLVVTVDGAGTTVRVDPGLAYDAFGRELLLWEPATLAIPLLPGDWTLVARAATEEVSSCSPPSVCWPASPSREGMALELQWLRTPSVRPGEVVPLLHLPAAVALTHRYQIRPLARPRVASGSFNAAPRWRPWVFRVINGIEVPLGIEVEIDIGAGGFTTPPHVVAWGVWPEVAELTDDTLRDMSMGWSYVAEVTEARFLFRMPTQLIKIAEVASGDPPRDTTPSSNQLNGEQPAWQEAFPATIQWLAVEIEPTAGM